jgi:hypothetical protein
MHITQCCVDGAAYWSHGVVEISDEYDVLVVWLAASGGGPRDTGKKLVTATATRINDSAILNPFSTHASPCPSSSTAQIARTPWRRFIHLVKERMRAQHAQTEMELSRHNRRCIRMARIQTLRSGEWGRVPSGSGHPSICPCTDPTAVGRTCGQRALALGFPPLLLCSSAPLLLCSSAPLLLCSSAPLLLCSSAPLDLCTSEYLLLWISGASILWRTGEGKTLSERYADHLFRWIGRQLLEVVSTEFRDRSVDYYVRGSDPFRFARGVLDRI